MRDREVPAKRAVLSSGGSGFDGLLFMLRGSRRKLVGEGGPEK